MTCVGTGAARGWALPASVCLVGVSWGYSVYAHLLRPGGNAAPASVRAVAAFVAIKAVLVLGIVLFFLRADGESLADLGVTGVALRGSAGRGVAVAIGLFLVVNVLLGSLLKSLGLPPSEERLGALFRDPRQALLWIFAGVVGGGFTEELVRAFVLTRFEKALGRAGLVFAVAADTAVFSLGHLYQGVTGAVQAAASGLIFALVFLRRRKAADAMAVHAVFDLLGIAAAYALYAGRA
jgi:membrane protease YdiL (CAAX protease family)